MQSGSGIAATILNGAWQLVISWSEGYISMPPYANVGASIEQNFNSIFYELEGTPIIHASWVGHFGVNVSGTFNIKHHPNGIKKEDDPTYTIQLGMGNYQIPSQYITR